MTYSQIIAQMRRRAEGLWAGSLDDLVRDYAFPFPLDLQSTRVVVCDPQEIRAMMSLQRKVMLERGVTRLEPEVIAVDLPRGGRFRVWVDWHEMSPMPGKTRVSKVIYYCSSQGSRLRIEMVRYLRFAAPELKPQLAALALTG